MGNDFYNPTGHENEGLPSGRNLKGQIALWHPVMPENAARTHVTHVQRNANFEVSFKTWNDLLTIIFLGYAA